MRKNHEYVPPSQSVSGFAAPSPVSPPPTGPEWGEVLEPEHRADPWRITANCYCTVALYPDQPLLPVSAEHCRIHTLADLVEGERLLRAEQGNTK